MAKPLLLSYLLLAIISACSARLPITPRIIGGTKAAEKAAPFIVSLQVQGVHNCGGSILNSHWVLTAGHCALDADLKKLLLIAGTNDIKNKATTVQNRKVDYCNIHPNYKGGPAPYDIALIYTAKPFYWTPYVKPVRLPEQGYKAFGFGTLYGWGSISKDTYPVYPRALRQASKMPILSFEECQRALSDLGAKAVELLDKTNLCTGPLNRGIQACSADSGGPLVQTDKNFLIGVVSWGPTPCGRAPSVFVQVADFVDWIKAVQKQKQHHINSSSGSI